MSKKHFSWLLIATLLLGTLVFLLPERTGKESEFETERLLPGLAAAVNALNQLQVITAGNQTLATLSRKETGSGNAFVVKEFSDYPADWPQLRELLAALAKANIVEPKTSKPEYFARLGVSDVNQADSQATLLRLQGENLEMAVLIGNAAEGRDGHYVRLADGDRALLIDQTLDLPPDAKSWLQRDIVNISDVEVVEFSVKHADGTEIRAIKASADDDDFTLQDLPEGREIRSSWTLNSMAGALSNLQLDAAVPVESMDFSAASQFRLLTADGLEVLADLMEFEEQKWLRLSARAYAEPGTETGVDEMSAEAESANEAETANATATESETEPDTDSDTDTETGPAATAPDRAAEINQRVQAWAYAIPGYKADAMNKQLEDLLKPLPDGE